MHIGVADDSAFAGHTEYHSSITPTVSKNPSLPVRLSNHGTVEPERIATQSSGFVLRGPRPMRPPWVMKNVRRPKVLLTKLARLSSGIITRYVIVTQYKCDNIFIYLQNIIFRTTYAYVVAFKGNS
jgi:hypothetical protein